MKTTSYVLTEILGRVQYTYLIDSRTLIFWALLTVISNANFKTIPTTQSAIPQNFNIDTPHVILLFFFSIPGTQNDHLVYSGCGQCQQFWGFYPNSFEMERICLQISVQRTYGFFGFIFYTQYHLSKCFMRWKSYWGSNTLQVKNVQIFKKSMIQ